MLVRPMDLMQSLQNVAIYAQSVELEEAAKRMKALEDKLESQSDELRRSEERAEEERFEREMDELAVQMDSDRLDMTRSDYEEYLDALSNLINSYNEAQSVHMIRGTAGRDIFTEKIFKLDQGIYNYRMLMSTGVFNYQSHKGLLAIWCLCMDWLEEDFGENNNGFQSLTTCMNLLNMLSMVTDSGDQMNTYELINKHVKGLSMADKLLHEFCFLIKTEDGKNGKTTFSFSANSSTMSVNCPTSEFLEEIIYGDISTKKVFQEPINPANNKFVIYNTKQSLIFSVWLLNAVRPPVYDFSMHEENNYDESKSHKEFDEISMKFEDVLKPMSQEDFARELTAGTVPAEERFSSVLSENIKLLLGDITRLYHQKPLEVLVERFAYDCYKKLLPNISRDEFNDFLNCDIGSENVDLTATIADAISKKNLKLGDKYLIPVLTESRISSGGQMVEVRCKGQLIGELPRLRWSEQQA